MLLRLATLTNHLPIHTTTTRRVATMSTPVKLAILDDYPGIARQHFSRVPNLQIDEYAETLNPAKADQLEQLVKRLQPYQIISTMRERTPLPKALLERLPNLQLILNSSVRNAAIDQAYAAARGIPVCGTTGDVPTDPEKLAQLPEKPVPKGHSSVVQHAWALILSLLCRIPRDDAALKSDDKQAWQSGLMVPIAGKTLGIVGLGKLGLATALVGKQAWGMRVLAWSENLTQEKADAAAGKGVVEVVGKEELWRHSDVVSLHLVLSARTKNVVGARELGWMKRNAVLINTSRGPLIDEAALIAALTQGKIGGAGLDVYWEEPLPSDSPWRTAGQWAKSEVVLSPHMGYANAGTLHRWYQEQAENVERWMKGEEVLNRMN